MPAGKALQIRLRHSTLDLQSHHRFKQRLLANKAREYPWCKVLIVDEAYTSKTCGMCGHIHQSLGGNKVFRCPHCSFEIDRNVNGARNILLRFLTLYHETSSTQ